MLQGPSQHLGPDLMQLSTGKNTPHLYVFHGKFKFCLEKVTGLPDLTVFYLYRDRYRYKSETQGSLKVKYRYRVDPEYSFMSFEMF